MFKKRVAVLRGGPSAEYDVSMRSGIAVLEALHQSGHQTRDITISKAGEWLVAGVAREPEAALLGTDVVFIALHGTYGEDGTVQRILDRLGVPYTGSGPYASRVAMNKALAKEHVIEIGIETPQSVLLTRDGVSDVLQTTQSIQSLFGPEYVIKPASEGSSVGIVMAHDSATLAAGISSQLEQFSEVLVEERIRGREATVGVLEGFRDTSYYQLPVVEIVLPEEADFFEPAVKYDGSTEQICPGTFTKEERDYMQATAEQVHKHFNLRQYSRSDFVVTAEKIYWLEVNTLPDFSTNATYVNAGESVGAGYLEIIEHLIQTV